MSVNEVGADHSSAEMTTAVSGADQSEGTATTEATTNDDFQRELDSDWGISPEETEEPPEDEEPDEEVLPQGEEESQEEEAEEEIEDDESGEDAPEPASPALHVHFLGQDYDLPENEARKFAQIGMNAGRLQEKVDALKPLEPLREAIEVLALFRNQSTEDVIKSIGSMEDLRRNEIAALVEQGHDEALAEELFESKYMEAKQKAEINRLKRPEEKGLTSHQRDQIERFARFRPKEHEDISAGKPIPEDVLDEWRNGTDLTTAWLIHENKEFTNTNRELAKKVKELEKKAKDAAQKAAKLAKNAENKEKAPTRKKGTGGGNGNGGDIFASWKVL